MRVRRSRAMSAGISRRWTASCRADSVWERRSVGARSLWAPETSTSSLASWRTTPASTTNFVIAFATLPLRPGVEDDRYRAVVHQLYVHACAEDPLLDRNAERAKRVAEALVQRLRHVRRRCVGEARAVALRGVREQRELGDDERGSARVEKALSKALLLVSEDAKARDLAGQPTRLRLTVVARDAEEQAQPRPDLPPGGVRALDTCSGTPPTHRPHFEPA